MTRTRTFGLALLLLSVAAAQEETGAAQRPNKHKKWRQENPPKMVVFGDSISDTGRAFVAPAAHQFEEYGIGPAPFERLYAAPDSDEKVPVYLPMAGSFTNGKVWPTWLRIPDEHNFATSSATASSTFRNREPCTRYTGEFEDFPTGTLEEQITRYLYDIGDPPEETLDYTHVILLGNNDLFQAGEAITRYLLGGVGYEDPVPFDLVFQTDNVTGLPILDGDGLPVPFFEPVIAAVIEAWDDGIGRLVNAGVTGTILLANMASVKGLAGIINTPNAAIFDALAVAVNVGASQLALKYPQVKMLDAFTLSSALVDNPSIFEDVGFFAPEGSFLADPCISLDFTVDGTAEIMGTQALRSPDCQETCALCADAISPCQNCLQENPSATICDDPDTRVFYDGIHFSTEYHLVYGEAIRQCAKDTPNYDRPWVSVLCPPVGV